MGLRELIAGRIHGDGPISFAEFMELSLYHSELGYYARAAQRTGRAGDFFTSVDVGSVFGELLAKQFSEMFRLIAAAAGNTKPEVFDLVEAGAGNGRLSRDVLDALERTAPEIYSSIRVSLVEKSPAARDAQAATLGPHAALLAHNSHSLPEDVHGVIFANELLDALPTHVVAMTDHGLREVFVTERDGRFVECFQEPSTPRLLEYLSRAGAVLSRGWRAEVNLAAEDWVRAAAKSLRRGFMVLIDYGHDERELYGESHASGTLSTFMRHTTAASCLDEPGACDITSHVDLTAATRAAAEEGLQVIARLDQTYFMLGLGLEEMLKSGEENDPAALQRRLALKTLMLPGGLGSTHKVLIFGRGVGHPALQGCSRGTRLT